MSDLLFDQFLVPFFIRFFFLFGLIGVAVGAGLVFAPQRMQHVFGWMNRWISTRRSMQWFDRPRDVDAAIYRFCRRVWFVLMLLVIYSIFVLITQVHAGDFVAALGIRNTRYSLVAEIVVQTVQWFLIAGELIVMAVGIMLFFFPARLITIEKRVNQWYSTHHWTQPFDAMHMGFDTWVRSRPRTMGGLITAGALFVDINFGIMLFVPN
ncbi:MAG: hypothetical protein A2Z93_03795 [Curvibacter sp. GWA2_64_110]|nr:MAG: hypothetical protein A2Z93_03795 [Curvibacter sp. GWA2_64_110]HCY15306.1 hypothetical protein [Curvibacter sp.]